MRRLMILAAITAALALGAFQVGADTASAGGVALAAPDERGNCVAVLTSHFGPKGEVDDAVYILQAVAAERGMTLGELAATLAGEEGRVAECLAVLGPLPVEP